MNGGYSQNARILEATMNELPEDMAGWHKSTPAIRAYADAEWEAMDEIGRLPKGWVNPMPWPSGAPEPASSDVGYQP